MKLAFVEILTKFEVFPCGKTEIPLKYSNKVLTLMPKHGIWLRFKRTEWPKIKIYRLKETLKF